MSTRLVILETVDGGKLALHPDRVFGVDHQVKVNDEVHQCVVAIRTIEAEKITLLSVVNTFEDVTYQWDRALEYAARKPR